MILTKTVGRIYKICFEISLWLNLVLFAVAGAILFQEMLYMSGFLGVLSGLVIGIIINISVGGFIIKLLHLDD